MNVGSTVVADQETFEVVEPGKGAFDHPAVGAKSRAVRGAPLGDQWAQCLSS